MRIFSGIYKNRIIQSPKGLKTRPTSGRLREALFNICQGVSEGARFLDLFAGSGAMGFEALSRGGATVTFVDNSKESIRCIQGNAQQLKVEKQVQIMYGDVFEVLEKLSKKGCEFDIIYADPPYDCMLGSDKLVYSTRVVQMIDQYPALLALEGSLFIEDSPESLPVEEADWQHLQLKSTRTMGRSALQHYIRREGEI